MSKVCNICREEKPLEDFYSQKEGKFGKRSACKICYNSKVNSWKANNPDKVFGYTTTWRNNNKEQYNKTHAIWSSLNRDKCNAKNASRRARKLQATPVWLTEEHKKQILEVYVLAQECEMLTGDSYHVDHIIPLVNKTVCGLHVPWNLQVLPSDLNLKKSNSL